MLIETVSLQTGLWEFVYDSGILALWVRHYVAREICEHAQRHVIPQTLRDSFKNIYRSQFRAFTDTLRNDPAGVDAFLDRSAALHRHLRSAFQPYANPVDRFRSELDEIWPPGAGLLRFKDRPLAFGMVRSWEPTMAALPHFDMIERSHPALAGRFGFADQFGVNIYVSAPEEGGTLCIWDLSPDQVDKLGIRPRTGTYGYDSDLLPDPDLAIKPATGDLVIVRSTRLHSVAETRRGRRVSVSGFIGYIDDSSALRLWS